MRFVRAYALLFSVCMMPTALVCNLKDTLWAVAPSLFAVPLVVWSVDDFKKSHLRAEKVGKEVDFLTGGSSYCSSSFTLTDESGRMAARIPLVALFVSAYAAPESEREVRYVALARLLKLDVGVVRSIAHLVSTQYVPGRNRQIGAVVSILAGFFIFCIGMGALSSGQTQRFFPIKLSAAVVAAALVMYWSLLHVVKKTVPVETWNFLLRLPLFVLKK